MSDRSRLPVLAIGVFAALIGSYLVTGPGMTAAAADREVRVYNWADYVDMTILNEFSKETGIKVVYDTYDSNEMLETKLLTGKSGYDLTVPSGSYLQRMIQAGVYQKLDKSKLPNLVNMWPTISAHLATFDPGNEHSVNHMWATTGLGYNVKLVKERLGDVPVDSWSVVFDPDKISKLKDCGVAFIDSPDDVLSAALKYLGRDPNSKAKDDIAAAGALLAKVRDNISKFDNDFAGRLATGDYCMVIGWSGTVALAQGQAAEAKNGVEIAYVVPKEGTVLTLDSWAIPTDAPHPTEAHELLNFLMRPDIAARNVSASGYASGNLAAKKVIDPAILGNKGIYPDDAVLGNLYIVTSADNKQQRDITRAWTAFKTGK